MVTRSRVSPPSHAHAQLHAWCRAHGQTGRKLIALTPGSQPPKPSRPTFAMAAFVGLMPAARSCAQWMAIDTPACPEALHAHIQRLACQHFPRKPVVIGITGVHTSATAWIFGDNSALLTKRREGHLIVYPGHLWIRSQEIGWTPSVLVGKNNGGPALRIAHLQYGRRQPPRHEILRAADALDPSFRPEMGGMVGEIQRDLDVIDGAFSAFQGCGHWPDGTAPCPHSRWPNFLPRRGIPDGQAQAFMGTLADAALWLGCALESWGERAAALTLHKTGGQLLAEWTPSLHTQGQPEVCPIPDTIIPALFAPPIAQALTALMGTDAGLSYRFGQAQRAQSGPWMPMSTGATIPNSRHGLLSCFAQLGRPPEGAADAWRSLRHP